MGFFDDVTDSVADRTGKVKVGMEPDVCVGCPERGDDALKKCGLCGCPTIRRGMLHLTGMVPENCRRISEHERHG